VATFTDCKIIAAESALTIMATHATLSAGPGVMVQRRRRSYLPSLRHSCSDLVALVTSDFLMARMIEAYTESWRKFRSASVAA